MSSRRTEAPVLAISIGDPTGIGPEVSVIGAARAKGARTVLVGDRSIVERAAREAKLGASRLVPVESADGVRGLSPGRIGWWAASSPVRGAVVPGRPNRAAGVAQHAWIDEALALVTGGVCDALVTGPVDKSVIARSGAPGAASFRGHTEHLADRLGSGAPVMAFWSERLTVALATTHVPLRRVSRVLDGASVERAVFELGRFLHDLGRAAPRIAVAGLNPHASDHGLLGDEEARIIAPAARRAGRRLWREGMRCAIVGPIGAETAFRCAARGDYDGVVAMYHDQATIPMKLLGFGEAVNVTLGLPIVRTSVDHGVAHDIAGKGLSDPRGMVEAIELAAALVRGRRARARHAGTRRATGAARGRSEA